MNDSVDASPRDSNGFLICHHECLDGSRCQRIVPFSGILCHTHRFKLLSESE